jgi:iron complex transport system permease protein
MAAPTIRPSRPRARLGPILAGLGVVLIASMVMAVGIGPVPIPFGRVWGTLLGELSGDSAPGGSQRTIVTQLRFPRVLLAAVVGGGLAVSGVSVQALVRNPLADPYILGVSAGAAFGAIAVIVVGGSFGTVSIPVAAFGGALATFLVVFALARRGGRLSPLRLILVGVAVAALLNAATNYIVISTPDNAQLRSALFWLLGGVAGARYSWIAAPAVVLAGVSAYLVLHSRALNCLSLGDETAATLGVDVDRFRRTLVILVALLVGSVVAVSGAIGFVALMLPHIGRLLVGPDHRRLIPVAALLGAVFLVWVDVGARMLIRPAELPIGVVTAAVGAPFFLWLLGRREARA